VWSVCVYSFGYGGHANRPHPAIQLAVPERDLGLYLCDDAAIKQVSKLCYVLIIRLQIIHFTRGEYRLILFVTHFLPCFVLILAPCSNTLSFTYNIVVNLFAVGMWLVAAFVFADEQVCIREN